MPTCAFLTIENLTGYVTDDDRAVGPLRERGWEVRFVPWNALAGAGRLDAAVIRTTWDYHLQPAQFLATLEDLVETGTPLANGVATVRWNLDKRYLAQLGEAGVAIVPTEYLRAPTPETLQQLETRWRADGIVVKPIVGASASDTFRLAPDDVDARRHAAEVFAERDCMVQPLIREVLDEGEYSLMFFDGEFSHGVLKTPASGDFRSQEEHGARVNSCTVPAPVLQTATAALAAAPEPCLYARVDLVDTGASGALLMELELIEPALYLRMDAAAPARFADAICAWHERTMVDPTRERP